MTSPGTTSEQGVPGRGGDPTYDRAYERSNDTGCPGGVDDVAPQEATNDTPAVGALVVLALAALAAVALRRR